MDGRVYEKRPPEVSRAFYLIRVFYYVAQTLLVTLTGLVFEEKNGAVLMLHGVAQGCVLNTHYRDVQDGPKSVLPNDCGVTE